LALMASGIAWEVEHPAPILVRHARRNALAERPRGGTAVVHRRGEGCWALLDEGSQETQEINWLRKIDFETKEGKTCRGGEIRRYLLKDYCRESALLYLLMSIFYQIQFYITFFFS
jgi:hypothetical protein